MKTVAYLQCPMLSLHVRLFLSTRFLKFQDSSSLGYDAQYLGEYLPFKTRF